MDLPFFAQWSDTTGSEADGRRHTTFVQTKSDDQIKTRLKDKLSIIPKKKSRDWGTPAVASAVRLLTFVPPRALKGKRLYDASLPPRTRRARNGGEVIRGPDAIYH